MLLDGTPSQIKLSGFQRQLSRHYRIGPARRSYDDPSYVHKIAAFDGNGLRPYSPCHLSVQHIENGDISVSWIRRTRIDGDSWALPDVPVGEAAERYLVRVVSGEKVVREEEVMNSQWIYTHAMQGSDEMAGQGFEVRIAQISDRFGPGPFASIAA